MPRHIIRLIVLMAAFGAAGYAAMTFFTADSFYKYGHYRGDSVAEIASDKPKYKGTASCESCHAERLAEWSKGVHNRPDRGKVVACETCHGATGGRDIPGLFEHAATGTDHPNNLTLLVRTEPAKLCTRCHERIVGRPAQQPQIVVADHAGTQQCTVCHNAHSPRLGLVAAAATTPRGDATVGKVKAAACTGCHGAEGVSENLPGPSLAGQNESYFVAALTAYSTGARVNPMMNAAAQGLSIEDTANIATYFSALKCESTLTQEKQVASAGQTTASKCIACHGANGVSANGSWPNLVGLSKNYLIDALRAYRDGARKNAMMAGIVNGLSDAHVEDAAAYYANATCR
jgi:cytochrome c553